MNHFFNIINTILTKLKQNQPLQYIFVVLLGISLITLQPLVFRASTIIEKGLLRNVIVAFLGIGVFLLFRFLINKYFQYINLEKIKLKNNKKNILKKILFVSIMSFTSIYLIKLLTFFITGNFDTKLINDGYGRSQIDVIFFMVTPILIEELTFRGLFLNFLAQKNKKYLGLFLIALLFVLPHISNLFTDQDLNYMYLVFVMAGSLFFNLVYLNFGLICSMVSHYILNVFHSSVTTNANLLAIIILSILTVFLFLLETKKIKISFLEVSEK